MTKVTFLGDSILMMGYGPKMKELLGDDFEVFMSDDNGRFSKYTLRRLFDLKDYMAGSRIVHWNNGLWDFCDLFGDGPFSTEEEYVRNMTRIADILLESFDKVIFATTTPVTENNPHDDIETIMRYNELIVPILKEKGVIINDLFATVSKDIDSYIRQDDNIHLTEKGAQVCAEQVAKVVREVAVTLDEKSVKTGIIKTNDRNTAGAPV